MLGLDSVAVSGEEGIASGSSASASAAPSVLIMGNSNLAVGKQHTMIQDLSNVVMFPIPFEVPPRAYSSCMAGLLDDKPWMGDVGYGPQFPDCYGAHS